MTMLGSRGISNLIGSLVFARIKISFPYGSTKVNETDRERFVVGCVRASPNEANDRTVD